jgi:hypothetical protein
VTTTSAIATQQARSPHNTDIYIDRAHEKTNKTNTDFLKTEADFPTAAIELESVKVEIVESSKGKLDLQQELNQEETNETKDSGEGRFSAQLDPEILKEIEGVAYDWRRRPWMASPSTFKPEMIQAVYRSNPEWYSLSGSKTPNLKKICDRLRKLDGGLRKLDALAAYSELQNYWTTAVAIATPGVDTAFTHAAATEKQQQLAAYYEQVLEHGKGFWQ